MLDTNANETETQDLTDDQLSDVFNEFADTLEKADGINQEASPAVKDEEDDETLNPAANIESIANAQDEPKPAATEEVFDIESLSPAAKKAFQDLEHKAKSQSGRVSALQQKLDEQGRQLEQLQQQGKGDSKAAQNLEAAIEETELDLGSLVEELPELKPFVDEFNRLKKQVNGVNTLVQNEVVVPGQNRAAQEAFELENKALHETHKDKAEIESNPAFWEWVDSQHESVRNLANSSKANDVSYLLSLYKKDNPAINSDATEKPKINRNVDDMLTLPKNGSVSSSVVDESTAFDWAASQIERGKL